MPTLLALPITPDQLLAHVIAPALAGRYRSQVADVMLLAIAMQESGLGSRWQIVDRRHPERKGPARGLWQFEAGGGCAGVLSHPASREAMSQACLDHGVMPAPQKLWAALETDDLLACKAARLLLYTDPRPLPDLGEVEVAWRYYVRNWRPGKPHRNTWNANYAAALEAVQ